MYITLIICTNMIFSFWQNLGIEYEVCTSKPLKFMCVLQILLLFSVRILPTLQSISYFVNGWGL